MNALFNINALRGKIRPTDPARITHIRLQEQPLHPAVLQALKNHEPTSWETLFWEWPYVALTDPTRLAYSRSTQHLTQDRQALTAPGKYLKRHFPTVPDHLIAAYAKTEQIEEFAFLETLEAMVAALEISTDAWSCMQGFADDDPEALRATLQGLESDLDISYSPYQVYSPNLGWKMAVRRTAKHEIKGRALVNGNSFVRSYTAPDANAGTLKNMADTLLENWLKQQGIRKASDWGGFKIEAIRVHNNCGYLLPYLDGNVDTVAHHRGDFIITEDDAVFTCNCTDGDAEEISGENCESCGARTDEDDLCSTEDGPVCSCCYENHYTYIESTEEAIRDRHVIRVNGAPYDERNLPEDIVELANGDYAHIDDVTVIDDECYLSEDCVRLEEPHEGSDYALREDAWQDCNGDWWHDDVESVEVDGNTYAKHLCEFDELDEVYYEPGTDMETLPSGMVVHPSNEACKQEELL